MSLTEPTMNVLKYRDMSKKEELHEPKVHDIRKKSCIK